MHEHVEADVPAWLLALVIVVVVSLALVHQARSRAARQVELRRLQEILAAENERAEKLAEQEYTSMLATRNPPQGLCAVCETPTNTRCSRCKSINYCSSTCQMKHWRQGHKNECRASKSSEPLPSIPLAVQAAKKYEISSEPATTGRVISTQEAQLEVKKPLPPTSEAKSVPSNVTPDGCLVKPKKILFSYSRFIQYFNWDIQKPPCGLINCGNSCFANVILQCLTYTRPLAAYLLEGSHRAECRRNDWCFMCELQDHTFRVFNSQIPFSPFRILSRLRDIGNHLGYGRQEDAHEFMRFAVDSMQSICLDQFGGEKQVDSRSQETTLVQYIFGGHLQSQVKCVRCGHESNRYENMMDLAVEIQGAVESLEDGLAQFTAPEWLDGENKYKCDRCNAYVKASKRLTIHEAPNVLTIALKRFQSGKFGKLNKRVTFPDFLNMSPYMSGGGDKPPAYKLYAVVVHVDMLNASFFGHYICYVRDMNGTWYKVDDSKVKEVETEKVMSQKAYMLMYMRSSPRPGPESAAGSLASSLMDVSVSHGRECSSSSCKYQRTSPIGQVHGEIHRVSPIIAGTLIDNTLVEDTVGRSYSTLQSSAIERAIDLGFDEPSVSESNTGSSFESDRVSSPVRQNSSELIEVSGDSASQPQQSYDSELIHRRKSGKRRLETEDHSPISFPGLCRTRSSSCPPVSRSPAPPVHAYELADDLPRTFGYSLCQRDDYSVLDRAETPSKRQHMLLQGNGASAMDIDTEAAVLKAVEDLKQKNGASLLFEPDAAPNDAAEGIDSSSISADDINSEEAESASQSIIYESAPTPTSQAELSPPCNGAKKERSQRQETNGSAALKPIFAKGFLNRPRKAVITAKASTNAAAFDGDSASKIANEKAKGIVTYSNGCIEKPDSVVSNINNNNNNNSNRGKIGRNDSCGCGSQRKWKKCCGIEPSRRLVA